jgi:hypothetical protein
MEMSDDGKVIQLFGGWQPPSDIANERRRSAAGRSPNKTEDQPSDSLTDDEEDVGFDRSRVPHEQRKRDHLWTMYDLVDGLNYNEDLMHMFGMKQLDDELACALNAALVRFSNLCDDGRATIPGMIIEVLKRLLENLSKYSEYFEDEAGPPRPAA